MHLPNAVALDELLPRDETIMITVDLVPQEGRKARESLLVHDHLPVDISRYMYAVHVSTHMCAYYTNTLDFI